MNSTISPIESRSANGTARPPRPKAVPVNLGGVPDELKTLTQWVIWSYAWKEEREKWDKPPLEASTGRLASSKNPATWATYPEAVEGMKRFGADGIGFVFTKDDPYCGVDLDDVRDPVSGGLTQAALAIIERLDSFCEVSPSGSGVHGIVKATLTRGWHPKGIGLFVSARYFCFTGQRVPGTPAEITEAQVVIDELVASIQKPADSKPTTLPGHGQGICTLSDAQIIQQASNAKNGQRFRALWDGGIGAHGTHSEADLALCCQLAFWTNRDSERIDAMFRQSGLMRQKWEQRADYRERTIQKAIDLTNDTYDPNRERGARLTKGNHYPNGDGQHADDDCSDRWPELDLGAEPGPDPIQESPPVDAEAEAAAWAGVEAMAASLAPSPTDNGGFSNFYEIVVGEGDKSRKVPIGFAAPVIHKALSQHAGGFPKCANGMLFAERPDNTTAFMKAAPDLFGWIAGRFPSEGDNPVKWSKGVDKVSQSEFFAYTIQNAERYDGIEEYPHWPEMPGHYYLRKPLKGGDGSAFRELLSRFSPATQADYDLIEAAWLTIFAGIEPGQRPAFLIQAADEDAQGGRGTGKTTLVELISRLVGGHVELRAGDDWDRIVTRLLSPAALPKRIALLDNVKSLRFSWADLEAGITGAVISGRQLYVGEGRRANTLTYFVTLNGANLSKDMAQRCVPIVLKRPEYDAAWEEQTIALIEGKRWEIIGDIIAKLQQQVEALQRYSRWSTWEQAVLARVADPSECQRVIAERQAGIDDDQTEADVVRDGFREELKRRGHSPDTDVVFIPSKEAAIIINRIENEERRPFPRAMNHLYMLAISEIRKSNRGGSMGGRGCVWVGEHSEPGAPATRIWEACQSH